MHQQQLTIPYTETTRRALRLAEQHARHRQDSQLEPEHLLIGILSLQRKNSAQQALKALNQSPDYLRQSIEAQMPPVTQTALAPTPTLGDRAEEMIHYAVREAQQLGHYQLDTVHLLMAMLYTEDSLASRILLNEGVTLVDLRGYVLQHMRRAVVDSGGVWSYIRPSPVFLALLAVMAGSGAALYFGYGAQNNLTGLLVLVFVMTGWILSVSIHEFAHALVAFLGGDRSVAAAGYLSLNPLKYTHPFISIMLPVIFLLLGGLGLPGGAVYINTAALRSPRWSSFVAVAGPLGTLAVALLLSIPLRFGSLLSGSPEFWGALAFLGFLQVTALMFNLLPIPPLDGFQIVAPFLPFSIANQMVRFSGLLFMLLLFLFWTGSPIIQGFWVQAFTISDALGFPLPLVSIGFDLFRIW